MRLYADDRGHGIPLLLLHGGTGSAADWRHVFPSDPPGFRVIAPDLRSHGQSAGDGGVYTIRDCAEDVLSLLDERGLDRIRAIGFSLGAKTLLQMAVLQPSRIDAMVIAGAAPYYPEPMRQAAAQVMPLLVTDRSSLHISHEQRAAIRARTLIVHGDRDQYFPVELAVELFRGIPAAALWVVPGADHLVIFGEHAPAFAAAATRFLQD